LTPTQAELLSEEKRKVLINELLETITVHLESSTQRHTLRLVFSETVSRLLEPEKYVGEESEKMGETSRGDLGAVIESSEPASEEIHGKKLCGSGQAAAAEINYSVTVE